MVMMENLGTKFTKLNFDQFFKTKAKNSNFI